MVRSSSTGRGDPRSAASFIVASWRTSCRKISYFCKGLKKRLARRPARSVPRSQRDGEDRQGHEEWEKPGAGLVELQPWLRAAYALRPRPIGEPALRLRSRSAPA